MLRASGGVVRSDAFGLRIVWSAVGCVGPGGQVVWTQLSSEIRVSYLLLGRQVCRACDVSLSGVHMARSGVWAPELAVWLNLWVRRIKGEGVWVPGTRGRTARGVALRGLTIRLKPLRGF